MPGFDKGEEDIKTLTNALEDKPKFARLCIYTLNCFGNLAKNRTNLDRMAKENSFKTILKTLKIHDSNPKVLGEGVAPLISACRVKSYRDKIVEEGGIEFCVETLNKTNDVDSTIHVSKLLEALIGDSAENLERFKKLGGEGILEKRLESANKNNNHELASSILNVLAKISSNDKACKEISQQTIEFVVESLKLFTTKKHVVKPALLIISNLCKYRGNEVIEKLRKLNTVAIISKAINAHSSDQSIVADGNYALGVLSSKSDLEDAVKKLDKKNINIIEKKEIVGLIGNLSVLTSNTNVIKVKTLLNKLYKIIHEYSKKEKSTDCEINLLISAITSAGKIAGMEKDGSSIYSKNIVEDMIKILNNSKLTPKILEAINISLERFINSEKGYSKILSNDGFIKLLYAKNAEFNKYDIVCFSSNALSKKFASKDIGVNKLSKIGVVINICKAVDIHLKNSELVINCYDSLISFSMLANSLSNEDIIEIIKSALSGLKSDSENIPVCTKALELLQILADKSQIACEKLAEYEFSSILSKFRNEVKEEFLIEMIDKLKASLKVKKAGAVKELSLEDAIKIIKTESVKIKEGETNIELLKTLYEPSEKIYSSCTNVDKIEKINKLDGINVIIESLSMVQKAEFSEVQDNLLINYLKILNSLNENGILCEDLIIKGHYQIINGIYSQSVASESLKSLIEESIQILEKYRKNQLEETKKLNSVETGFSDKLVYGIGQIGYLSRQLYSVNSEARKTLNSHPEIDFTVHTILNHGDKENILSESLMTLEILNSNPDNRIYFLKTHLKSLCDIIKKYSEDEMFCSSMLGMLNNYENDPIAGTMITELKNWYLEQINITDINAMKIDLLNKIYVCVGDSDKEREYSNIIQRLEYCYDPKNELVDKNLEPTKIDLEVLKLFLYSISNEKLNMETKKKAIKLMEKMILNKNIEQMAYDNGVVNEICQKLLTADSLEKRKIYLMALSPFLSSSNDEIKKYAQSKINEMIGNSLMMDDEDRNDLLGVLVDTITEENVNVAVSSACLENILKMFELQKNPQGKAKCLALLSKMTQSSEEVSLALSNGKGLDLTMASLETYIDSSVYVERMTELSYSMATHPSSVEKMFEKNVDKKMKELMFKYSDRKEIFHNAQRTIDLMMMSNLNLSPEELKKWKARSRIKQLMTELCRGLGIMIASTLTKGEREVRTGDTANDISKEARRILNEFGSSFDDAIEADSSTKLLCWLGEAWLLRANLMAYTFLVEKDVSARGIINAPKTIEQTLVNICGFRALWDFENRNFENLHRAVRGGIGHQSVRIMLDASVESQPCQEYNLVTKEPIGREYNLEDLIVWVKMDTEELDTLRCFNLMLSWVMTNWNLVTITASMLVNPKNNNINERAMQRDGLFLAVRSGLSWHWPKEINRETYYIYKKDRDEDYNIVGAIQKEDKKTGLHIKVKISGEELRQKRREIKDTLSFSNSNVLNGDEKDELDFFIEVSNKGSNCRKYYSKLIGIKAEQTFIQFNQREDGDLYFSWGKESGQDSRQKINMKEVEAILEGKSTKTFQKAKEPSEETCFSLVFANEKELNIQMNNKGDRDIWVRGLKLVLCTLAGRKPVDMIW